MRNNLKNPFNFNSFKNSILGPGSPKDRRECGIALVVVFILVIILYLIVFQLEYSTKMEEELAEVRTTESATSFAVTSVASYIMSLLAEDAQADQSEVQEAGMAVTPDPAGQGQGAEGGGGDGSRTQVPGGNQGAGAGAGGLGTPPPGLNEEEMRQWLAQQGQAAGVTGQAQQSGTLDYILENIFLPTTESIDGVEVKIQIIDNARCFDLNRLWEYPREQVESLTDEQREEEFNQAVATIDDLNRRALENQATGEDLELNNSKLEWVAPSESKRELVREMLTRAIQFMFDLNIDAGFEYVYQPQAAASLATLIEDYCYKKRAQPFHNTIAMTSELLIFPDITPEIYYGPHPEITPQEDFTDLTGDYLYRKDEFGDLIGEYQLIPPEFQQLQEQRMAELELLQQQYGRNQTFPQMGGLLGNSLTRNMQDLPNNYDNTGVAVAPKPIGLRDLFCTLSNGKININTADRPIIYALLLSLEEDDAKKVADDLYYYRHDYQELEEEEEGDIDDGQTKDYGQPKRQPPPEDDEDLAEEELDPEAMMASGSGYEDYETNYFTNLRQIVLIDGQEGGQEDLLTDEDGVERIDEDFKSPLQLVTQDLENAVTFGSSYFTARLKIKSENSPIVTGGEMIIHRDVQQSRMEVVQWKEFDR